MDVDTLTTKKAAAEARFSDLETQKTEIDREMYRLQGEYRLYNELIEQLGKNDAEKMVDPATIIDVEESLKESGKKNGSKK